jgi:hypothetical protein
VHGRKVPYGHPSPLPVADMSAHKKGRDIPITQMSEQLWVDDTDTSQQKGPGHKKTHDTFYKHVGEIPVKMPFICCESFGICKRKAPPKVMPNHGQSITKHTIQQKPDGIFPK